MGYFPQSYRLTNLKLGILHYNLWGLKLGILHHSLYKNYKLPSRRKNEIHSVITRILLPKYKTWKNSLLHKKNHLAKNHSLTTNKFNSMSEVKCDLVGITSHKFNSRVKGITVLLIRETKSLGAD
jgi:hypothetical protein